MVSTTELYQLVKMPLLVQHLREHRQENENMTLWAFLCMHYDYGAEKDADYAKDMALPFKANDSMIHATIADFIPNAVCISIAKPNHATAGQIVAFDESDFHSSFLSNIWQPPKSC